MTTATKENIDRKTSYINHLSHIENIPNPEQIQYLSFTHSVAWSFNKEKKRKLKKTKYINIYFYNQSNRKKMIYYSLLLQQNIK